MRGVFHVRPRRMRPQLPIPEVSHLNAWSYYSPYCSVSLARRNCQSDNVAWPHRHLLADWSLVAPNGSRQESNRSGCPEKMPWNREYLGGMSRGQAQPNPLTTIHDIYHHVGEPLVLDLYHR